MADYFYYFALIALVLIGGIYFMQSTGLLQANAPANNTTEGVQYGQTVDLLSLNSTLIIGIIFAVAGFCAWRIAVGSE